MTRISLAHGNGGRHMRQLIEEVFAAVLHNPVLATDADAVGLPDIQGSVMMTVDGFTVQPLEFPGGDIGTLAVYGTVNDLAVAGARPKYLSLSVIIEEGLELVLLQRVLQSMAQAAVQSGVMIACGDTKVVPRGQAGGLYLSTAGIGTRIPGSCLGMNNIRDGDSILVSGPVGDHGTAIMLAREQFGLSGDVRSDCANVLPLCETLISLPGLRFMRDPTRGGLATVLHEIQKGTGLGMQLQQSAIPVHESVSAVCEILGYDPLYLACEGRVVAVVAATSAATALNLWRELPQGESAQIIGTIDSNSHHVRLITTLGGERFLEELEDDPLPRIC
ncbi:MAG: hydrogenase expression/formation protein HypE [Gammaproteobacteria bacterium]|nr:hydrogenase expression/formation protein HypE [Gammaproteobacteria bacterium]MDH5800695.1 hydrogenase expression/formation protein HypE [Gammaproteobacteria bacterium]